MGQHIDGDAPVPTALGVPVTSDQAAGSSKAANSCCSDGGQPEGGSSGGLCELGDPRPWCEVRCSRMVDYWEAVTRGDGGNIGSASKAGMDEIARQDKMAPSAEDRQHSLSNSCKSHLLEDNDISQGPEGSQHPLLGHISRYAAAMISPDEDVGPHSHPLSSAGTCTVNAASGSQQLLGEEEYSELSVEQQLPGVETTSFLPMPPRSPSPSLHHGEALTDDCPEMLPLAPEACISPEGVTDLLEDAMQLLEYASHLAAPGNGGLVVSHPLSVSSGSSIGSSVQESSNPIF